MYQPKLNLKFEEPIYEANELDKVLQVLEMVYPGLKWAGGDLVSKHNVIRNSEDGGGDFEYEPIYYLTIGFFSHYPDRLTYTSAPDDDIDIADDEMLFKGFNWVDGWQWVRDNEVDYDKTTNIFNQLNESYFLNQTNLKGFKFKKTLKDKPHIWIIRTVLSDNGDELYFKYELSEAAEELLGPPVVGFSDMPKNTVINLVNSGELKIIEIPDIDTENFFD
jgi:hypothetical protein